MIVGSGSDSPLSQSIVTPALRARMNVRHASPPDRIATSRRPAWMSSDVAFTSDCGLLPPIDV